MVNGPMVRAALVLAVMMAVRPAAGAVTDPFPTKIANGTITIELQPILTGLVAPVDFLAPPPTPGDNRLYVVEQTGQVRGFVQGQPLQTVLDVSSRLTPLMAGYDERGLLGLAFDPNFAVNRTIYTYTSEPRTSGVPDFTLLPNTGTGTVNNHSVLAAWTINAATGVVDPASRRELLRAEHPQFNHNGGSIAFGQDGMLYLGIGDGGAANDVGFGHAVGGNAQNLNTVMGKILRIDPHGNNSANGDYGIPASNPFAAGGGLGEIYAYGFRNPYKFSFDTSAAGLRRLIVADVGQNNVEEVDVVTAGANYGWNRLEGVYPFDPATGMVTEPTVEKPGGLTNPVVQYDHDEGIAVVGGFVYRGSGLPELVGKYVFGDFAPTFTTANGRLFYTDLEPASADFGIVRELMIGPGDRDLGLFLKGFGEDAAGELYVLASSQLGPSGTGGVVLRIVAVPEAGTLGVLGLAVGVLGRRRGHRG
jgi:glucose/arabinose dehydrogenase